MYFTISSSPTRTGSKSEHLEYLFRQVRSLQGWGVVTGCYRFREQARGILKTIRSLLDFIFFSSMRVSGKALDILRQHRFLGSHSCFPGIFICTQHGLNPRVYFLSFGSLLPWIDSSRNSLPFAFRSSNLGFIDSVDSDCTLKVAKSGSVPVLSGCFRPMDLAFPK